MTDESETKVLHCSFLLDGTSGPVLEDATVLVSGERIREIGHRAEVEYPPDAEVIDLGDRWLIPGLIDAHVHFYGVPSTELYTAPFEQEAYRALRAAGEGRRMLEAGITAARCCGSSVGPALRRGDRRWPRARSAARSRGGVRLHDQRHVRPQLALQYASGVGERRGNAGGRRRRRS